METHNTHPGDTQHTNNRQTKQKSWKHTAYKNHGHIQNTNRGSTQKKNHGHAAKHKPWTRTQPKPRKYTTQIKDTQTDKDIKRKHTKHLNRHARNTKRGNTHTGVNTRRSSLGTHIQYHEHCCLNTKSAYTLPSAIREHTFVRTVAGRKYVYCELPRKQHAHGGRYQRRPQRHPGIRNLRQGTVLCSLSRQVMTASISNSGQHSVGHRSERHLGTMTPKPPDCTCDVLSLCIGTDTGCAIYVDGWG